MIDTRLKIAVFIDFDNIEIGVKTTLGLQLDVAAILEGVKERGEIVTKVAYGDWKRAGEYGRLLSQHAIRMVQRNVTPGGDKNGADINLALDALEMAFTHDHINAFVIVGGDSDFITLVEKLKQYDKKVFVVGGRQFTSFVMQKNCHEFIAYENLVSRRPVVVPGRRSEVVPASQPADVAKVIPLVKRALKILADREVSPQLGLLKSTLLQLDSAFSERDYGASTFRDFIEKIARTGAITLRNSGRSMLVDPLGTDVPEAQVPGLLASQQEVGLDAQSPMSPIATMAALSTMPEAPAVQPAVYAPPDPQPVPAAAPPAQSPEARSDGRTDARLDAPVAADPELIQRSLDRTREIFTRSSHPPRWPMYVRQLKQYLRAADEGFDERRWGFGTIVDLVRAGQRDGLFRLERDRKGIMRVFAGAALQRPQSPVEAAANPSANESGSEFAPQYPELNGDPLDEQPRGRDIEPDHGLDPEPEAEQEQEPAAEHGLAPEVEMHAADIPEAGPGESDEPSAPEKPAARRGRAKPRKPAGKAAPRKAAAKGTARKRKSPV